jgi:signal transduction histidine kinase/ActR/RegA family two-component response regulator
MQLPAPTPSHEAPAPSAQGEHGILVLAPTSNDARLTANFLQKAGYEAQVCQNLDDLEEHMQTGCGALVLAEEALDSDISKLVATLERQPSWSDLPLILITAAGGAAHVRPRHLEALGPVGNISIIERPVRPETLVSTCEVALRSRRRQYQVRDLLSKLDEADRRKDEFLAMLAHELRNPLAAVANAASLLNTSTPEDREWATGVITRQSSQLAHLIDDLLDVSRITTGKIRLRKELIDVGAVLDRARDSAQPLINSRKHELICNYASGFLWLDADPTRLEQIVLNLLTNAAKYTPAGGRIDLSARLAQAEILITVRDNGIGVAPHRMPEMFQLFAQGERSIARSEGGLGIGLTIVQKLVEMHGGRIEAQSDGPNRGSTFTVCFPAATISAPAQTNNGLPKQSLPGRRVLIVDDNIDTAQGLARILTRAGHEITVAHDGNQALVQAREQSPQSVILDIGLPGMDGFEVARRLRSEAGCANALIIAVTGYGQPEDRQKSIEAGFDHHLVKPVDLDELKKLLNKPLPDGNCLLVG